jgi:hypothetical protein
MDIDYRVPGALDGVLRYDEHAFRLEVLERHFGYRRGLRGCLGTGRRGRERGCSGGSSQEATARSYMSRHVADI